jgi:hypothetical protein
MFRNDVCKIRLRPYSHSWFPHITRSYQQAMTNSDYMEPSDKDICAHKHPLPYGNSPLMLVELHNQLRALELYLGGADTKLKVLRLAADVFT